MVSPGNNTTHDRSPRRHAENEEAGPGIRAGLRFEVALPERNLSAVDVRQILREGSLEEKAALVSELLSYTPWSQLWVHLTESEVRDLFPHLDLPPSLQKAWAAYLRLPLDSQPSSDLD